MAGEVNNFGAAPANSPAATPAPAAVQAPAASPVTVAPAAESTGTEDLASALRQEMMGRFGDPSARAISDALPAGLVGGQPGQPAVVSEAQAPDANGQIDALLGKEPGAEKTEEKPEVEQEPIVQDAAEDQREEISAVHLTKFGRDYSLSEIETAIEGFNYYHPKVMKLQEDYQRLQSERQEFEQLKSSPEMQLATMLKSDPALKQRFLQAAREHNPEQIKAHEENEQFAALKAEIEQLKGQLGQTQQIEQQRETQQKQAAWQRHVVDTTRAVDQATTTKLESLKQNGIEISEQEIELVCQNAVAMVQAGKLKYDAQSMTGYFNHMFDLIAGKALAAKQQGVQNYRQQKQTLPPPPPSGGAAPVIQPDSPKNFQEMQGVLANRLESVLNQL